MNPISFVLDGGLRALLGKIPTWLYAVAAVALLLGIGAHLHSNAVHKAIAAAEKRGEEREAAHVLAAVEKIQANAAKITANIRSKNNEANIRIRRDADDLRLRGPGKALCTNTASSAPVRPSGSSGQADAAVAPLSNPGGSVLIAVPFNDLILFAEQHDRLRAAVQATVEQHDKLQAAQPALPQPTEQPK
jgi:hypothetical protein